MTIIITSQSQGQSSIVSIGVPKVRAFTLNFNVRSLLPISNYTFWCNGVDMSWSCQQFGKRLGDQLTSDDSGQLIFKFIGEMNNEVMINDMTATKKHLFQLKDINDMPVAISTITQTVRART